MAHASQSDFSPVTGRDEPDDITGWVGWVLFGGVVLLIVGMFNAVEGLVALFRSDYYRVSSSGLVINVDYNTWGWTLLIFGAVLAVTGVGVMAGQTWARVLAVILVILNALTNLAFLAAYPIWSVLVVTLDIIVVYALIVHGRETRAIDL
jgi:hypothetical protein